MYYFKNNSTNIDIVGMLVEHKNYGKGKILLCNAEDGTVLVRFDAYSDWFHNGFGLCEDGHGWIMHQSELNLIGESYTRQLDLI